MALLDVVRRLRMLENSAVICSRQMVNMASTVAGRCAPSSGVGAGSTPKLLLREYI